MIRAKEAEPTPPSPAGNWLEGRFWKMELWVAKVEYKVREDPCNPRKNSARWSLFIACWTDVIGNGKLYDGLQTYLMQLPTI